MKTNKRIIVAVLLCFAFVSLVMLTSCNRIIDVVRDKYGDISNSEETERHSDSIESGDIIIYKEPDESEIPEETVKNETSKETEGSSNGWDSIDAAVYVLADHLNIRSAPESSSSVLGHAYIGDSFIATAHNGEWYETIYEGHKAYLMSRYVTINSAEATFEDCEEQVLKIKNIVIDPNATKDADKYVKVMLRTDPVVSDNTASGIILIYSDTANGELVKIGSNKAGTWYKVTYNGGTYYIASGAFKYFEGYTGNNAGGLG